MSKDEPIISIAFARAGLLGNPSDGYHGKAIGISVRDFRAVVTISKAPTLRFLPSQEDQRIEFDSMDQFATHIENFGFYGGLRLIKAAVKRFHAWCRDHAEISSKTFEIQYQTNIPRSVGLAGSSAIVTATLKALRQFYQVTIPNDVLASLTLSAEKDLLGIPAGLMDRVVQSIEGMVFMDFSKKSMQTKTGVSVGQYQSLLPTSCEGHLFLAWASDAAEPTEVLHNRLQERFNQGDKDVVEAMSKFAEFAEQGKSAIQNNDIPQLATLIDRNFDLRKTICQLPALHQQMVSTARLAGGSAKFCGSGGAIIGTVADPDALASVETALKAIGCEVIQPTLRAVVASDS